MTSLRTLGCLAAVAAVGYLLAQAALHAGDPALNAVKEKIGLSDRSVLTIAPAAANTQLLREAVHSEVPSEPQATKESNKLIANPSDASVSSLEKQFGALPDGQVAATGVKRIVPTSSAQRREFADMVLSTAEAQAPGLCEEIVAHERSKLSPMPGQESRQMTESALLDLRDSELGYRLEFNEALRKELLEGNLATENRPSKDRPGVIGKVSAAVGGSSVWGAGGVAEVSYFIEFSKYERLAAADRQLSQSRRRIAELVSANAAKSSK